MTHPKTSIYRSYASIFISIHWIHIYTNHTKLPKSNVRPGSLEALPLNGWSISPAFAPKKHSKVEKNMETKNEHWACRVIRETRQAGTLSPVELIEQRLGDRKRHSESLSDGIFGHKTRRRRSRDREYCQKCISKRFMGCVLVQTFLHYCHHGLQRFVRIYESPCDTWCSLLGRRDSPLCLTGSVAATAHNLSSSTSSCSSRWKG